MALNAAQPVAWPEQVSPWLSPAQRAMHTPGGVAFTQGGQSPVLSHAVPTQGWAWGGGSQRAISTLLMSAPSYRVSEVPSGAEPRQRGRC